MALLYRSLLLHHPTSPPVIPFFRNYPSKPLKSSSLPFLHHCRQSPVSSVRCSSSSSSSAMESPPEGYRRNVGVCLMNPSKKVVINSRKPLPLPRNWSTDSFFLISLFSMTSDFRCLEVGYSQCLANASGDLSIRFLRF